MTAPLNVPDEFIQGLFKSAPALWQALAATYAKQFASSEHWQQQMAIWTSMMARATGQAPEPVVAPERGDRRFSATNGATTRSTACSSRPICSTPACSAT